VIDKFKECEKQIGKMTSWEASFIADVKFRIENKYNLTRVQEEFLGALYEKYSV